jgi:hypothetical protein
MVLRALGESGALGAPRAPGAEGVLPAALVRSAGGALPTWVLDDGAARLLPPESVRRC